MNVGFTGTQRGMTDQQRNALVALISNLPAGSFHHGDCIGADAEADEVVRRFPLWEVVIHPPDNPKKRAFCARSGDVVWESLPYIERNHDIVNETEMLIATPGEDHWRPHSGTWATINYARKLERPTRIIKPDGGFLWRPGDPA